MQTYLCNTLGKIADAHPVDRINELMPWCWAAVKPEYEEEVGVNAKQRKTFGLPGRWLRIGSRGSGAQSTRHVCRLARMGDLARACTGLLSIRCSDKTT